ncbi:RNA-guided endonuclease InsQ/TnpB family protein [Haloarcula nitratireducens]|uniref:Transposase n=1 Tax=Haloarcula nitratireducens TaxID=2487749 RepID=A0AAW4PJW6_9EURY|nr:RNA-guided endonuclease TnpB family protein [Halomicroarcula nitratireducens]MBX0298284.1 transposase [Halomicroarcula nitratireducens]
MRRANTFSVRPLSHRGRLALIELLDSSAACFNEINYDRRQAYFSARHDADDHHTVAELKDIVRDVASQEEYRNKYIQQLSSSIPQQLDRKNWQTWKGFFDLLRKYRDPEDDEITDEPSAPGYWKEDGTRQLHTVIRNDTYSLELGERSRLEIPLGKELKEKYGFGYNEKLRLEVRGRPHWKGPNGSLELSYDRTAETFTARQSVGRTHTDPVRRFTDTCTLATTSSEDEGVVAAVDIGANNLAAVVTSEGDHVVFHGRPCFEQFHALTREIADLQSGLPDDRYYTDRIERLYRRRQEQRDHAQDALVRHLARWLVERGVTDLYAGKLDDVRKKHWSATVNEKTDLFWAHGRFRDRLEDVLEDECGITVHEESEAGTSSECPVCGVKNVHRSGDLVQCLSCGFEGHSDVVGAVNFLAEQADLEGGPMARPAARGQNRPRDAVACLEWDDHRWQHRGHSTKEEPADRSTRKGNLASGAGSGTA